MNSRAIALLLAANGVVTFTLLASTVITSNRIGQASAATNFYTTTSTPVLVSNPMTVPALSQDVPRNYKLQSFLRQNVDSCTLLQDSFLGAQVVAVGPLQPMTGRLGYVDKLSVPPKAACLGPTSTQGFAWVLYQWPVIASGSPLLLPN